MAAGSSNSARSLFRDLFGRAHCQRTLKWEGGYWGGTLTRWYGEGMKKRIGLPKEVQFGETIVGPASPFPSYGVNGEMIREEEAAAAFGLDPGLTTVPFNYWIDPVFEEKVVFEDEACIEKYGEDGIRTKNFRDNSSMPMWLEFPVKDRQSWEKVKEERFDTKKLGNRFRVEMKDYAHQMESRSFPLGILNNPIGFFGSIRNLIGEEQLFLLYYDDPKLVHDILDHLCGLWMASLEALLGFGIDYDVAFFWEDMAGNNGSLISPAIFREFMSPRYKRMIDYMKARGVKNFIVDTDGKMDQLISLFLEVGINIMYPCERRAGNDLLKIRKQYPELGMMGGIDKTIFGQGTDAVDKELLVTRDLVRQGGFVPFVDHLVPPNCSWEEFVYYRNKLNEMIDTTTVL
jgi:hypothetical protein